jgi:hypothetical protein
MTGSDIVKVVTHNVTRLRHTHTPRDHGPTANARHTPCDHGAGPQHTHNVYAGMATNGQGATTSNDYGVHGTTK